MTGVAFVIPWFGPDLKGGAEQQAWQVTTRLASRGHAVEVLTTGCRAFHEDWGENHLPEGVTQDHGITIRRFPVARRNRLVFDEANRQLLAANARTKLPGVCPVSQEAAQSFVRHNIHSPRLIEYLDRHGLDYQAIVFIPYLYGPILTGLPRVNTRAVLQPCLHDESYAYLPAVAAIFHQARRLLFNSEGEALLAATLYGPAIWAKGVVVGEGVEVDGAAGSGREGARPGETILFPSDPHRPYLLYLGRRDPTKNTDLLLRAYAQFRRSNPDSALQLVLAGPGDLPPVQIDRTGVVDLGLVSERQKAHLLRQCLALLQPSLNESFSRTMMEGWLHGKPVLVHRECLATALAVQSSGGGWVAGTQTEWADLMATIEKADPEWLAALGARGREYARTTADWDLVIARYEAVLGLRSRPLRSSAALRATGAVHQLLPNLSYGDAISNHAVFLRDCLRSLGYHSEIFVRYLDERMAHIGKLFVEGAIGGRDGLLYHHSIGSELTPHAIHHPGPKVLIYHNITPARFYEPWEPNFARILDSGRKDLKALAPAFPASVGDSAYNAAELEEAGFHRPGILPIAVDPIHWDHPADPELMRMLQDGLTNVLFVGRLTPNKCQHHLLAAFREYLELDGDGRLLLAGKGETQNPYTEFLAHQAEKLGIASRVVFTGEIDEGRLAACYRTAHLFWSMSEHEGFGVPLVEAMWFDVPVLAYRSTAVPETLGEAGIMFAEKQWPEVAALASLMVRDGTLRRTVLSAQRARRTAFLPERIIPHLLKLLDCLNVDTSPRASTGQAAS